MSTTPHELELTVEGMDCADCARTIGSAVERLPGVASVDISFATGRMLVAQSGGGVDRAALARRVRQLGYGVADGDEAPAATGLFARLPRAELLTLLSAFLLLVAVVVDFATGFQAAWLYGAAVAVGIGPIARAGVVALVTTRRPEIKFLMTVASIGAIAIGAWMEAALVVVLFSIGEWLEGRAVARARRELASLVTLAPETARVRVAAGGASACTDGCCDGGAPARELPTAGVAPAPEEREVPVAELRIGDVVIVRPGERLPADGTVLEGRSAVDQAPITGESVPVDKGPGDTVFAGTLNAQGLLAIAVERAPGDTTLARIGRLVADAQAAKAPSERWVDAFARVYTPVVIAAAVLVAALPPLLAGVDFDDSFYSALALLILACPCALVLSTPVTIVSALARASAAGVLVKGGEHLERAAAIEVVAFDKTGTLTAGRPRLVAVEPLAAALVAADAPLAREAAADAPAAAARDAAARDLLATAAALERGSEHPLAAAIVAAARERGIEPGPVDDFEARTGFGATGRVDGREIAIGKPAMFEPPTLTAEVEHLLGARRAAGETAIVVARDGVALGVLGLADPPRPEAAEATAQLRRLGIERTVLLTGDNAATARAVADAVGIAEVRADALPADKARALDGLGDRVAMVGDGVNDAPALAAASLGMAMGSAGSDTAVEVADVALMGDDPRKVAGLIGLARWTRATVRANIGFSLATKAVAALLLVAGMLPLWAAVASDVGASLVVVLWGLRLLVASPRGALRGQPILPRPVALSR